MTRSLTHQEPHYKTFQHTENLKKPQTLERDLDSFTLRIPQNRETVHGFE